jgi:hypothetical protein
VKKTSLFSRSRAFFALSTLLVFVILAVPIFVYGQSNSTNTTHSSQRIGVKITSPKANQTVPIGELTINGTSSDSLQTNCQVFVDLNDTKPMQNVTGVGAGGPKDYSNWTFTYTQNYHVIDKGMNELTSKISCYDNSGAGNTTTKYYSINITGTDNPTIFIPTTGNYSIDNSTTGFHTVAYTNVLPQYSTIDTNNSKSLDENAGNNSESLAYEPTGNVYSGNNENSIDNSNDINHGNNHRSASNPGDSKHNHDSNSNNNNNDNGEDKNKDNEKTKSHSAEHSKSLKVEKIKHTANNLKHEEHLKNLSKYIHNVVKERLHRMTEKLSD